MSFVQAKCENCGGILTVDSNLKASNCTFCGTAYVVQDSINYFNSYTKVEQMHADVVQISDESTSEGRLRAAEALMKLKKFNKAEVEYKRVTELTPQNYRGWLGLIESHTELYNRRIKSAEDLNRMDDYARSAVAFAPSNQGDSLLQKYRNYSANERSRNSVEIASFDKAINDQTEACNQYSAQIASLSDEHSRNEKRSHFLSEKVYAYQKRNRNKTHLIWGLVLIGVVLYISGG